MKKTRIILGALLITGLVSTSPLRAETSDSDTSSTSSKLSTKSTRPTADQKFMQEAALGGLQEVEMGHLAEIHGQSQAVKDFGRKLVEDHGKANDELNQLAKNKGIVLSELAGTKKGKQSDADQHLAKLAGADFDKAFASHMVKDHEMDIKKFEHQAAKGTDPEIKAFAEKCLPTLREHLAAAKKLDESHNARAAGINEPAGASTTTRSTETSTTK
ncbi:MAG: hypothetical protein JWN25_2874 [Verrucomicrobiales bacterium]|nr:hypothetical protein [Verrucomicrobiales bacterium]MDB6131347.1 hypothetical protein [Verrucomicrobiales bacterium]